VKNEFSDRLKSFIFFYVDSVELLEVLLAFHRDPKKIWTVQSLAHQLRSNPNSVTSRFSFLKSNGFISESPGSTTDYFYNPTDHDFDAVVTELALAYRTRPHKVFELIFSPMKKARHFADAFRVTKPTKDGSENE
jgi:hypothetical protein